MANLSNLEPQVVWNIFEQMCAHPRPSKHEEKVSAWIQQLAKDHNIECKEDKVGNLFLRKAATVGMEDRRHGNLHMCIICDKPADMECDCEGNGSHGLCMAHGENGEFCPYELAKPSGPHGEMS